MGRRGHLTTARRLRGDPVVDVASGRDGTAMAVFSPCRRWRYEVARTWDAGRPRIAMVLLNPSTADAVRVDPTVRRCLSFARAWGGGALSVTNCFAWCSTDPAVLLRVADPVGPDNDHAIVAAAERADVVVAAWGVRGAVAGRDKQVRDLLIGAGVDLHVLRLTRCGHPAHPLYLPGTLRPQRWTRS